MNRFFTALLAVTAAHALQDGMMQPMIAVRPGCNNTSDYGVALRSSPDVSSSRTALMG